MKGDFTRDTFDKQKHFSRVLMQQGRVQLDADWNEQAAIALHYLRALAADLIGPHGGPISNLGFKITKTNSDYSISGGRYYVNGLLCENETDVSFADQPDWKPEGTVAPPALFYLDVWERLVTCAEDDSIREVALNGPDTAVRAKVVWQVKSHTFKDDTAPNEAPNDLDFNALVEDWQPTNRGQLKARAAIASKSDNADPCAISPDARYRGAENQLYRVEIHKGEKAETATFKWSRENGAVIFPIETVSGQVATVTNLTGDGRFTLQKGDWVELVDDNTARQDKVNPLYQVADVDYLTQAVTLETAPSTPGPHPLLRRWDHRAGDPNKGGLALAQDVGAAIVKENTWLTLEDGIQIWFQSAPSGEDGQAGTHNYRTGDYWLIPARVATGNVEWPRDEEGEKAIPPHGVEHHYAPLAIVQSSTSTPSDCRHEFKQLAELKTGTAANA